MAIEVTFTARHWESTVVSPAKLQHVCALWPDAAARWPLQGNLWKRKGWKEMDKMRSKLEDLKELRDLVRAAFCAPACIHG